MLKKSLLSFLLSFSIIALVPLVAVRAQQPELVVQTGHYAAVYSVAFSSDGKTMASASDDKTIRLWDIRTGMVLRTLTGHPSFVYNTAFSSDGKTLASGSVDETIKLWDLKTGQVLRTINGGDVIAFHPDGKTLASGGINDGTVKLWDVTSGQEVKTLTGHSDRVNSIAFTRDGKVLASGSRDHTIKLWDVESGRLLITLTGPGPVTTVAFSLDGKTLASGRGNTIRLWDAKSGTELRTLTGHSSIVSSILFSSDGKTFASGSWDKTIKVWDVETGKELITLTGATEPVGSVTFSPDGKILASGGGRDKTIRFWDVQTGKELRTLTIESGAESRSVAFSPDGKILASGGTGEATIKVWGAEGADSRTLTGHPVLVSSVAFSSDGTLASGGAEGTIIWDVKNGSALKTLPGGFQRAEFSSASNVYVDRLVNSIAFSPDGKAIATGAEASYGIRLWDVRSGRALRTFATGVVESLAFSPDGRILVSGGALGVQLWEVRSGRVLRTFSRDSDDLVWSVAVSPVGGKLASASNRTVKLWDARTGKKLRTLNGHTETVTSVAFSPDGNTLASGSSDRTIKLWDVNSGEELKTLDGHSDYVNGLTFSPNGKTLASVSQDRKIIIWDVATGNEICSLIALGQNDWLVVTPDGLFDGSPAAWKDILWRFNNNTFDHAPVEAFYNEFYYPGLLADILAGKRPKPPSDISQKDRRQPQLKLTATNTPTNASDGDGNLTVRGGARNVALKVDITESAADKDHRAGSGAQDVRLFRNGSLVKVWRGDVLKGQASVTLKETVPIVAGENKFTAYAFNHDNIKSSDAELTVTGAESLKRQGTAYVVAIGVNDYANQNYNLKYAVADAEDFAAEVKRQQESLKRYAKVEVISLEDSEATKANIAQRLSALTKQVQPEDAVIVFFAGHGTAHGNQFYLIPHDLGYDGPRDNLTEAALQIILAHSVSDRELEKLFEGIDAGQLLLVIDACNSGQALEAEEKRRGPMNSKGLAQLAYEKGMYVLTAAQSYQAAKEAAMCHDRSPCTDGHGFLTYALIEKGLKQGAADREPKNGSIDIREWLNFATDEVPKMQEQNSAEALRGRGRYVVFVGDGRDVGIPKTEGEARDNVQRPRVFYRRELESNPLVIANVRSKPLQ